MMSDSQNTDSDRSTELPLTNSSEEVEEVVANTQPMAQQTDIDEMAARAGVEMSPEEPLNLKNKLEERDRQR
ncbi:MAG: DUF6335 family protein [Cyanobacteriota bacterium]|nr:DUF6335 family protein [Cyanobacteriota bacterium]